jgi:hypothetical protein
MKSYLTVNQIKQSLVYIPHSFKNNTQIVLLFNGVSYYFSFVNLYREWCWTNKECDGKCIFVPSEPQRNLILSLQKKASDNWYETPKPVKDVLSGLL